MVHSRGFPAEAVEGPQCLPLVSRMSKGKVTILLSWTSAEVQWNESLQLEQKLPDFLGT